MIRFFALLFSLFCNPAFAQLQHGISAIDPFTLPNELALAATFPPGFQSPSGLTLRVRPVDTPLSPTIRHLVLITMGQSNCENVNPTVYVPVNTAAIDQFSLYDSGSYNINGPLIGAAAPGGIYGFGNVAARLADLFVTNNIFDHVIVAPLCIGSTAIADWVPPLGFESTRINVLMARLLSRGIQPGQTNVTFGISWWQGEADGCLGTTASAYIAALNAIRAGAVAAGFSGRFFVNIETLQCGTSPTIQGAQASVVNGTTFFSGGNVDTIPVGQRFDGIHFTDIGAQNAATLVYNAMHASGAPY